MIKALRSTENILHPLLAQPLLAYYHHHHHHHLHLLLLQVMAHQRGSVKALVVISDVVGPDGAVCRSAAHMAKELVSASLDAAGPFAACGICTSLLLLPSSLLLLQYVFCLLVFVAVVFVIHTHTRTRTYTHLYISLCLIIVICCCIYTIYIYKK